jgi:hypothetical protein
MKESGSKMRTTRRTFVVRTAGIAMLAMTGREALSALAQLEESDPSAQALGYRADASHVDRAKYPRFKDGQRCGNCQFSQGKPGDASAQCALFGARHVSAAGWCDAYQARLS